MVHRMRTVVSWGGATCAMILASGAVNASLIVIPDSDLHSSPGVYTAGGYYTDTLGANIVTTGGAHAANVGETDGRNDDGYMALSLGFDVSFFGNTYDTLYINNNGNVSFGSGISSYVTSGPTGADAPVISPFFSDVDTTNPSSGVVHYDLSSNQLIVTWDNVGYYDAHADETDSYQLVLRGTNYNVPVGEGSIGFFYEDMGWESAPDSNSLYAATGFGDGLNSGEVLQGSDSAGLDSIVQNKYIWFDPNLNVVPPPSNVPEPDSLSLFGIGLLAAALVKLQKRKI